MSNVIPRGSTAMAALLRADFTTQWRNRRAVILVLLVPLLILVSWKGMLQKVGAPFLLSTSITLGLIAIGLMGYSNSLARDRDRGVFQRLRVAPMPHAYIMISRIAVQLTLIVLLTVLVFAAGYQSMGIVLPLGSYALGLLAAFIGGAMYLGLGQVIAGVQKNAETVNATTRLLYFAFIMLGMFGEMGVLGNEIKRGVHWSPYGTVKTIVAAALQPAAWQQDTSLALLATLGYGLLFTLVGIRCFRWNKA